MPKPHKVNAPFVLKHSSMVKGGVRVYRGLPLRPTSWFAPRTFLTLDFLDQRESRRMWQNL